MWFYGYYVLCGLCFMWFYGYYVLCGLCFMWFYGYYVFADYVFVDYVSTPVSAVAQMPEVLYLQLFFHAATSLMSQSAKLSTPSPVRAQIGMTSAFGFRRRIFPTQRSMSKSK